MPGRSLRQLVRQGMLFWVLCQPRVDLGALFAIGGVRNGGQCNCGAAGFPAQGTTESIAPSHPVLLLY
eukprot:4767770-Alexandrium_andersonii.AAC.1